MASSKGKGFLKIEQEVCVPHNRNSNSYFVASLAPALQFATTVESPIVDALK